jgi:hypothetical protein
MSGKPPKSGFPNTGWRRTAFGQGHSTFVPEIHAPCNWNTLLRELQLTEEEALLAVVKNDVLGKKLRVFARRVYRVRYVPEDVLMLLDLNRASEGGSLSRKGLGQAPKRS